MVIYISQPYNLVLKYFPKELALPKKLKLLAYKIAMVIFMLKS